MPMSNKERKAQQRQDYHRAWLKVKHNHGGLAVRKKELSALGSSGGSSTKGA